MDGQALAAILMASVAGARLVPGTVDVGGPGPEPAVIRLRDARVERLLGTADPARRARPSCCGGSASASPTPTTGST